MKTCNQNHTDTHTHHTFTTTLAPPKTRSMLTHIQQGHKQYYPTVTRAPHSNTVSHIVTQTQLDIHPGDRHTFKHLTTPGHTTKPQGLIQNLDLQPATDCTNRPEALDTPRPRPGLPDPSPSASPWSRPGPSGANDLARTSRRKVGSL